MARTPLHYFDPAVAVETSVPAAILLRGFELSTQKKPTLQERISVRALQERHPYLSTDVIRGALDRLSSGGLLRISKRPRHGDQSRLYKVVNREIATTKHIRFRIADAIEFGVLEAVLLFRFGYWISENKNSGTALNDGKTWHFEGTSSEMAKAMPFFGERALEAALARLVGAGVLVKACFDSNRRRRRPSYAFADEGRHLAPHLDQIHKRSTTDLSESPACVPQSPNGNAVFPNAAPPSPNGETTIPNDFCANPISPSRLLPSWRGKRSIDKNSSSGVDACGTSAVTPKEEIEKEAAKPPDGGLQTLDNESAKGARVGASTNPIPMECVCPKKCGHAANRQCGLENSPMLYEPRAWLAKNDTMSSVRRSYSELYQLVFDTLPSQGLGRVEDVMANAHCLPRPTSARFFMLCLMLNHRGVIVPGRMQPRSRYAFYQTELVGEQAVQNFQQILAAIKRTFPAGQPVDAFHAYGWNTNDIRVRRVLSCDGKEQGDLPGAGSDAIPRPTYRVFLEQWFCRYSQTFDETYFVTPDEETVVREKVPSHPVEMLRWLQIATWAWRHHPEKSQAIVPFIENVDELDGFYTENQTL